MRKRVLGFDPLTGLLEYHAYDPATDRTIIESVQDVAPGRGGAVPVLRRASAGAAGVD